MADSVMLVDVPGTIAVARVEELISRLQSAYVEGRGADLRIPTRFRMDALGAKAAAMQLIGSWARLFRKAGALRTYLRDGLSESELVDLLDQEEHLLFAACVAPRVFSQGMSHDITDDVRRAARKVLSSRQRGAHKRSMRSVLELVSDESPELAPYGLYRHGDARYPLDLNADYIPLADRIIGLSQTRRSSIEDPKDVSSLSWTLLELFQNTDQWARSLPCNDEADLTSSPSARFIFARWHSLPGEVAARLEGQAPEFGAFLTRSSTSADSRARFFEISISDMGPGIAGWRAADLRRRVTDLSDSEELSLVRWSLAKRRTTSLDPTKGMGFHRAFLNLTRLGGIVQIRTGGVSVYRDFQRDPYPSNREAADSALPEGQRQNWTDLRGWDGDTAVRRTAVSRVVGSRITMLIPDASSEHVL
ncbi:hypothetical protein P0L94_16735 [Microbacter sp. GSS18]|nr:hypothetical protein P0L94_16735 [Microbacter sp. GSS18]